MIREGDLLAGKYRVERLLGEGGMGYVVAAIHEQLQQRVAVKFLSLELSENSDAAARFLREARAAVRIQSEHVARVLDVGELEDGAPYMVMEYLLGSDLAQELNAHGALEIPTAIDYVLQACEAVAEAHSLGVIHRDLKPANLFLTRRPDGSPLVKVLDFGISKALTPESGGSGASPSLTAAQSLLGSPAYMSPEQARRPKSVDARTDIWSFGVILYEFLLTETPFPGDAPLEVLTAAASDPMPSLHDARPEIPRELEAVVAKCLEKKPENRYQSVSEFAQALTPFAATMSMHSIARISGIQRSSTSVPSPASATLRSASVPAGQVVDTEVMPTPQPGTTPSSKALTPAEKSAKDTQMDWGKSQGGTRRSRRRLALAIAGAGAVLIAIIWLLPGQKGPSVDVTPKRDTAVAAQSPELPQSPPAPPAVATTAAVNAPSVVPMESVAPRAAVAAPSSSATPSRLQSSTRVRAIASARALPPPVEKEDPLDGRR